MFSVAGILICALGMFIPLAQAHVGADGITCDWGECDKPCGQGLKQCTRSNGKVWYHNCHVQDCVPLEGCGRGDIVFVFDSSNSIGDKSYWVLKQFAVDVMKGLTIAPNETRIAAVTYSNHATTRWDLAEYTTEEELETAIWTLPWEQGITFTADGLEHAHQIIRNGARGDVKHIVVVITDGESNVKKETTIPKAEEMHQDGIEIFTIGIGNIDEDECRGIASELKDVHFHYVVNYNALVAITNTIINDTCIASNLTDCDDWTDWSECQLSEGEECGEGQQSRFRECRFYLWKGADPDYRVANESMKCEIPCPETPPGPGGPEPPCPEQLPCNHPTDGCNRCGHTTCSLQPTEDNCNKFTKCVRMCECVIGDEDDCKNDPLLSFPFNDHFNDISCNKAIGKPMGNVKLSGGAALFDGSSKVEIGFLRNWFLQNPSSALTVALWFRYTGDDDEFAGLLSNGQCEDGHNVMLGIAGGKARGQLKTGTTINFDDIDSGDRVFTKNVWTHVALVYSGWDAKYYVNGQLTSEQSVSGNIANSICSINIGFTGLNGVDEFYFKGYIDDVRVYRRMLYDFDVAALFNHGRQ